MISHPPIVRNFDLFRVSHSSEAVSVAPAKLREWAKRKVKEGEPKVNIYTMKEDRCSWASYSEVQAYILANSEAA